LSNTKERGEFSRINEIQFKRGVVRLRRVEFYGWIDLNGLVNWLIAKIKFQVPNLLSLTIGQLCWLKGQNRID